MIAVLFQAFNAYIVRMVYFSFSCSSSDYNILTTEACRLILRCFLFMLLLSSSFLALNLSTCLLW